MNQYTAMLDAHLRAGGEIPCRSDDCDARATPEQLRRSERVHARALEVFGSRIGASVWCHSPNERACGRWTSPWAMSRESEDGCRRVLIELDRIEFILHCRTDWIPLAR
ncbi:MAG: hypothetical protein WC809_19885 [Sinimarinibacterium sp.]|jgi:hypothetical protein